MLVICGALLGTTIDPITGDGGADPKKLEIAADIVPATVPDLMAKSGGVRIAVVCPGVNVKPGGLGIAVPDGLTKITSGSVATALTALFAN
jgi:hypothetical protein